MRPSTPTDRIYLDHAATTPLCREAREAMLPWLTDSYGNPSSLHREGRHAKDAIDSARETLSKALGCLFAEVLFTSGGTEAANLAIVGAALQYRDAGRDTILLGASEHHCVLHTEAILSALGYRVTLVPVDREARLDRDALDSLVDERVLLVSCMHANNELGTINPIREIADRVHRVGALLHCDAVQTFHAPGQGWTAQDLDADILTASGHKIYGPKGIGAIYIRAGVKLKPLIAGGGQERDVRGGTENVAAIAGFAAAVQLDSPDPGPIRAARDRFVELLRPHGAMESVAGYARVLPGHAHVRFAEIDAESMLIVLDRMGLSASSGSACSSGSIEPSHVLLACGYSDLESRMGLRFTFGRGASVELAAQAAERVIRAVEQIRGSRSSRR